MKRVCAVILALVMLFCTVPNVFAIEILEENIDVIIHDEERVRQIDELFALRELLELDFEANKDRIEAIDQQLVTLGVEVISADEVANRLGVDATPHYEVRPTGSTQWTSRRIVTTYNGQHYEVQILEGYPLTTDSPLYYRSELIEHQKKNFIAGAFEVIKVIAADAVGGIPEVGPVLSAGITVYEAMQATSNTTLIEDWVAQARISLTSHAKYILVKRYDEPDLNNQAVGYRGSSVAYRVSILSDSVWFVDGVEHNEYNVEKLIDDTCVSEHYNSYSLAVKNYHYYRNYNTDYSEDYQVETITMEIFERERIFEAPFEFPYFE